MSKPIVVAGATGHACESRALCLGCLLTAILILSCAGLCQRRCGLRRPGFVSVVQRDLLTADEFRYSRSVDVSRLRTFSLLVVNKGNNSVLAQPELTPDEMVWDSFGELAHVIEPGAQRLFVPQHFLRFVRVKFCNAKKGRDTVITIWCQGQT